MASILGKPGGPGQFPTHDLSTVQPRRRQSVYCTFNLPQSGLLVLGPDLNCSESRCCSPTATTNPTREWRPVIASGPKSAPAAAYESATSEGDYLCVRERDKRLELVTTRLAFPQVLYAMPIQISRPIWQEHCLPAARHSLVRHGDLQSETAMT